MIRLYDFSESGNCYKVRLLLAELDIAHELIPMDILKGETRSKTFLAKNLNHRVPVVEWPDGRTLAESNAILFHLAEDSSLLPKDPWERAQILQWMFFEQYSHEPYIAVVRFWVFSRTLDEHRDELSERMRQGYHALDVMETHLATRSFFVGDRYTVADIALYAYTHVAHEGGFELDRYPRIQSWIDRIRSSPKYISIDQ